MLHATMLASSLCSELTLSLGKTSDGSYAASRSMGPSPEPPRAVVRQSAYRVETALKRSVSYEWRRCQKSVIGALVGRLDGQPRRMRHMNEIIFLVVESPEGGLTARALGESIFTEADDLATLEENVRDAVRCHFDQEARPQIVRMHFTREQVIAV